AALEQALQHELDLETAFLVLLDAERKVLEVDEYGGRQLAAPHGVSAHGRHLERCRKARQATFRFAAPLFRAARSCRALELRVEVVEVEVFLVVFPVRQLPA